jgi:hypothetical protein
MDYVQAQGSPDVQFWVADLPCGGTGSGICPLYYLTAGGTRWLCVGRFAKPVEGRCLSNSICVLAECWARKVS